MPQRLAPLPSMMPRLNKRTFSQRAVVRKGSQLFLRMGGEDCEYDPRFRLYLQTRLSNPHYRPEVFATCTLINFIVTERCGEFSRERTRDFFSNFRCCVRSARAEDCSSSPGELSIRRVSREDPAQ